MRWALWLLGLFGVAVAMALGLGVQWGTVTVFVPPHRIDLSLNLALLLLALVFLLSYAALRAVRRLLELPAQARRWRLQQRERAAQQGLLQAMVMWMAGRFLRARKASLQALQQVDHLLDAGDTPQTPSWRLMHSLLHLLAAENAHALRDQGARDAHFQQALGLSSGLRVAHRLELRDAAYLNATRWALHDRDSQQAHQHLAQLPLGVARRTVALRLRLKTDRLAQQPLPALETARLLAKHGAFSATAARSLLRGLAIATLDDGRDIHQLQSAWAQLLAEERGLPDVALHAAQRCLDLKGDPHVALQWLWPIWSMWVGSPDLLDANQKSKLALTFSAALWEAPPESEWLARIEEARLRNPRSLELQYLSGMVCLRHGLWGKAQQMLEQVAPRLGSGSLQRQTWRALAELAEQKGDSAQALACWKLSAKV